MRQTAFARTLLQRQTTPEEILWRELRGRRFHGVKFRRRVPVMGAIADFLCHSTKLIVEVDGRQHRIEAEYDEKRTRDLEAAGFMVVRVTNEDVRERPDAVLERIGAALRLVRGHDRGSARWNPFPGGREAGVGRTSEQASRTVPLRGSGLSGKADLLTPSLSLRERRPVAPCPIPLT